VPEPAGREEGGVRIYLPATLTMLRELATDGTLGEGPVTAFAVTPALREWYLDNDEEVLEYAAFSQAARASLRLLEVDPLAARRRVVLAVDLPDGEVTPRPELDRAVVRTAAGVPLERLASIHVDGADAESTVAAAARAILDADLDDEDAGFLVDESDGFELEWYGVQELPTLVGDAPLPR
jgi:hypothetical protein